MTNILTILIMIAVLIILGLSILYFSLVILNYQYNRLRNKNGADLSIRINNTDKILSIIDSMIEIEVVNQLKTIIYGQKTKYDYRKLDDDSKEISLKVYEGLSSDVFLIYTNEILIQDKYIMAYITRKALVVLLDAVIAYNSNFTDL